MSQLLKKEVFPYVSFFSRPTVLTDATGHSVPHHHDFYEVFKEKYHVSPRKYRAGAMVILGKTE